MASAKRVREKADGTSLGESLKTYLRASGIEALVKYPGPARAWREAVGPEIAEHAHVFSFRRGVLEVAVDSSALMNEMEFRRAALLKVVQEKTQRPFIRGLTFVLKAFGEENEHDQR